MHALRSFSLNNIVCQRYARSTYSRVIPAAFIYMMTPQITLMHRLQIRAAAAAVPDPCLLNYGHQCPTSNTPLCCPPNGNEGIYYTAMYSRPYCRLLSSQRMLRVPISESLRKVTCFLFPRCIICCTLPRYMLLCCLFPRCIICCTLPRYMLLYIACYYIRYIAAMTF